MTGLNMFVMVRGTIVLAVKSPSTELRTSSVIILKNMEHQAVLNATFATTRPTGSKH